MPTKSTRLFRGLPVVDATRPMTLHIKQIDAKRSSQEARPVETPVEQPRSENDR